MKQLFPAIGLLNLHDRVRLDGIGALNFARLFEMVSILEVKLLKPVLDHKRDRQSV